MLPISVMFGSKSYFIANIINDIKDHIIILYFKRSIYQIIIYKIK
jgi:hypothetical protein